MAINTQDNIKLSEAVIVELKKGRKIQAIKLIRNEHGLGLKDSKALVEVYIEEHSEVKEAMNANKTGTSIIPIIVLLIVFIVIYQSI